ncbi:hypothetical protein BV394_14020 [Brevirhabdus pacifica]|uniref:Uncharacterized protein n=1 Tax=Brevirhabdus pacifica TaxID=1267768 RepID=A0A1U7DL17_9RHOB|nr:hypothetical protein [Brevirhabdus pacifica]APX90694.1 hypothetical protein BV394_14020 [Brevirhabdus pacifica]PJJ85155.1 hypothetical protein CLV77_2016 [Brevirhabdus pacifica]
MTTTTTNKNISILASGTLMLGWLAGPVGAQALDAGASVGLGSTAAVSADATIGGSGGTTASADVSIGGSSGGTSGSGGTSTASADISLGGSSAGSGSGGSGSGGSGTGGTVTVGTGGSGGTGGNTGGFGSGSGSGGTGGTGAGGSGNFNFAGGNSGSGGNSGGNSGRGAGNGKATVTKLAPLGAGIVKPVSFPFNLSDLPGKMVFSGDDRLLGQVVEVVESNDRYFLRIKVNNALNVRSRLVRLGLGGFEVEGDMIRLNMSLAAFIRSASNG